MKGVFRGALTTAMGEVLVGQRWARVALGAWLENVDVATWNAVGKDTSRRQYSAVRKKDAFFTFDLFVILFLGRREEKDSLLVGSVSWCRSPLKNSFKTYFVTRSILS